MDTCTIIVLGITGDLSRRKLIPALYHLIAKKQLKNCAIIGAAIDATTVDEILLSAEQYISHKNEGAWQQLKECMTYQQLDFTKPDDFTALAETIKKIERAQKLPGNRLIYLATAAHFFCPITESIARSGIAQKQIKANPWQRIVYEKPFGSDLASAREINACIAQWFDESQIYRIDHYLTKELVGNIALVRFTNLVFEPLWNNRYVDQVQIVLSEKLCLENRGSYFDAYGTLRDVFQNHMLQLLSLIAMESPEKLTGNYIREERAKVLKHVKPLDGILGQYDGYQQEPDVAPDSKTETFAMLQLAIDNYRWKGVPFYLRTGKCLDKRESMIHIKFKQVDCLLTKQCPSEPNWLTIQVAPDASFSLSLNAKKPGETGEVVPVAMEFCHSCMFGPFTAEAYEILIEEIIRGEQSIAVRFDEIEYAWQITDAIYAMNLPLYSYQQGSAGPKEITTFNQKHGVRWRS